MEILRQAELVAHLLEVLALPIVVIVSELEERPGIDAVGNQEVQPYRVGKRVEFGSVSQQHALGELIGGECPEEFDVEDFYVTAASSVNACGSTFSATSRLSLVSLARYTFHEAGRRQAPFFLSLCVPP